MNSLSFRQIFSFFFAFAGATAVPSAVAQSVSLSGGGTIHLGESTNITATPTTGIATAYNLIENGVVVQTVGTFGIGGSSTAVGQPYTFTVTPSSVGTYFYSAQVALNMFRGHVDYVPSLNTVTLTVLAPAGHPPTVAWTSSPGTVGSGQSYSISAHGHDQDGDLTAVSIWKNEQPFAFAGGGNGFDGDSSNPTSDTGPQTITFTAQAVDSSGATSAIISQTVTITAPAVNQPPAAAISGSTTLQIGETGSWSFSATDQDGNLARWRFYASANPNPRWSPASGASAGPGSYSTSFSSAGSYTWIVETEDSAGARNSASITVSVSAPVNRAPTIAWDSTPNSVASGQTYTVSARGHDDDGDLTQVNVWRNGSPYAFAGGGNGFDGDSGNPSTDTGPQTITYTAQAVDGHGATSGVISQTVTISAPTPVNHAPTIAWTATPGAVASGQSYAISAHGHDQDSNLSQIRIWKNGQPFTNTVASGADSGSSGSSSDTGPQTITFTAQAFDASGSSSGTISQTVMVSVPPPVQYTLTTSAGAGGSVSPGGTYNAGTVLTITATADAMHDFAGWSGDAGGTANPVTLTLDRNKSVTASFSPKMFALATSASSGGTVTPGGSYPVGSWVTVSASPYATHRFTGWSGDANGTASSVAVYLDRAKSVQALFASKASQTISFAPPGDQPVGSSPVALSASASSGLPVTFAVLSGPATINGGSVHVTGPGAVTIQASQLGDANYLPAAPVSQTFNVIAPVALKYRPASRTLLASPRNGPTAPLVVETP